MKILDFLLANADSAEFRRNPQKLIDGEQDLTQQQKATLKSGNLNRIEKAIERESGQQPGALRLIMFFGPNA